MSEVINSRLKNSIGKKIKIFLKNGFKFEGKVTNFDKKYLEILDDVIKGFKIIRISEIEDFEVFGGKDG